MSAVRADSLADATPLPEWHLLDGPTVVSTLGVDPAVGLGEDEVAERARRWGPNRLADPPQRSAWLRFLDQFRSGIVYILVGAAVVAALVGDAKDPIVIGVVLLLNAVLGFVQESRAEGALDALRKMLTTTTRVRRGGAIVEIDAEQLVPGDVVLVDAGDRVPADGRLLTSVNAVVDESSLTGESNPVPKVADALDAPVEALADRHNLLFMNTTVVAGRAEMVVTDIGMGTEMGRVAHLLSAAQPERTPLQRQLDRLGKRLAMIAVAAVAVVFGLRLWQGDSIGDAVLAAVALAVAAIPEGLPAVVTVTLAVGVSQMAKRRAIVKRLPSVETLGATTVICSDKTGTLTLNQMTLRALVVGGRRVAVSGEGYSTRGRFSTPDGSPAPAVEHLLEAGALANDAIVHDDTLIGDPTEGALVVAAYKAGIDVDRLRSDHPRVAERPFDSASKFMVTVHEAGPDRLACMKGAPETVLQRCTHVRSDRGSVRELDPSDRSQLADRAEELAADGLRVLAVATRVVQGADASVDDEATRDFVLEGLVGLLDPPRPEAKQAVELCRRAGISVKMITGDHASTAATIARELGIDGEVVTGADLERMSDAELAARINTIGVCARVSPNHKVRVVDALRANGQISAMTGDGVNDAAALRKADIGVAMGITGTEVTKEAGDMVLVDDNFATIVDAVERGRTIYDNILKFVRFQLSTNLGAISTILGASLLGMPLPLTAIQLLWVNIIADGPPAMTLGIDPPDRDVMQRSPRPPDAPILTRPRLMTMLLAAITMAVGTIGVYRWAEQNFDPTVAQTMAFTTFVLFQMVNVLNARSERRSVFSRHSLRNSKLWLAIVVVIALQGLAVGWSGLHEVFGTTALDAGQWLVCGLVALTVLVVEEVRKAIVRRWSFGRRTPIPIGTELKGIVH